MIVKGSFKSSSNGVVGVQRGLATLPANTTSLNITISEVNMDKAEVRFLSNIYAYGGGSSSVTVSRAINLTNSKTLTIYGPSTSTSVAYYSWEITERV